MQEYSGAQREMIVAGCLLQDFLCGHDWEESRKVGLLGMHVGWFGVVLVVVWGEASINSETCSQSSTRSTFIICKTDIC